MTNLKNILTYKCRSLSTFKTNKTVVGIFFWGEGVAEGGLSMRRLYKEVVHSCYGTFLKDVLFLFGVCTIWHGYSIVLPHFRMFHIKVTSS